jgi:hypothetical protein
VRRRSARAAHRADNARNNGAATAALTPVPGTSTTRTGPVPAEVRCTWPALVSTVAQVSGKSAPASITDAFARNLAGS